MQSSVAASIYPLSALLALYLSQSKADDTAKQIEQKIQADIEICKFYSYWNY